VNEAFCGTEDGVEVLLGIEGNFSPGVLGGNGQERLLAGKHIHCDLIGQYEQVLIELLPSEGSSAVLDQFHCV
jgi:hypothetical protein